MNSLGASAYEEATAEFEIVTGTPDAEMVQRVGRRIAAASKLNYEWEFRLLDAPDVANAFALPGGKVAVYSGLLSVTQNEDALAAVLGHEVAHVTAEHGNERMTQTMLIQAGLVATGTALNWSNMSDETRYEVMAAINAGAQFGVLLPYSRTHESEADEIGLRVLVRAGYDPYEAPKLWERMAELNPNRPPVFLSTHPDPADRAQRLRELIPAILAEEGKRD